MKLFWAPQTRSTRAIWMLEELGIDYERELVDIRSPDRSDSAEFRTASPMGKVPALIDGETAMSESAAICLYLADRYGGGRLAPAVDAAERGRFLYWIMYTPAVVEPAMSEKFSGIEPNRGRSGWGDFDSMIATWEQGLGDDDWIVGNQFSAADVMLGSSAVFLRMFDMLPDLAVLGAYADRCLQRPAYRKAIEISS
ncbi:MAG: glutathione S-transferase [Woeseiaceae bacterium]|nr:glutathione S-transferase [Woeseiaceae bacterium]